MDSEKKTNLNEIWHACRKIQGAIFRYGFNICADFCPLDPQNTGLVSSAAFIDILGKYKMVAGLSDFELREVMDYFRLRDGRVSYRQFCKVVCHEEHNTTAKKDLVSGLEWNDPMHVNVIAKPEERRRLCLTLIKIAQITHLPLAPYFQDYELVSDNVGCVTVAHFSRVLHFIKIPLSDDDFILLLKRYMKDSYLVNYIAFLHHIENILEYLKNKDLTDSALHIIKDFPGRLVDLELPELPAVDGTQLSGNIFKDICNHPKQGQNECDVIFCIQKHVHKNRVRVREFLEGFDILRIGTVTKNQFERGLFNMGVGRFLTKRDISMLCNRYIDPIDTNRVRWRAFEDEIDQVFTVKHLDKMPQREVESPPQHIKQMPRTGETDWNVASDAVRNTVEKVIARIQIRIRNRRLHLHPFFRNFDRLNNGHVTCGQANQVFQANGILLSPKEITALTTRYGNELGFNYTKFLEDADPAEYAVPQLLEQRSLAERCANSHDTIMSRDSEEHIIKLLSNCKRQVVSRGIPVIDFMQDYDRHREGEILEPDFRRGLDNASIKLTVDEVDTLCKIFRSPKRACCILYRDFCKALEEIFIQIESVAGDEITAVPLNHLANTDCFECFLNFDERTACSQGLMKLARKPDEISNLKSVFQDFDRENCGSIRQNQFLRALTIRDMNYMISTREYEAICKCFGVQRGLQLEFNYREFLNVLNILFRTGQVKRNY